MNKSSTTLSALERAERILSPRLPAGQTAVNPVGQEGLPRAEAQVERFGHSLKQGIFRIAARGYVAAALRTQQVADSVSSAWQQSVEQARREREEQVARTEGAAAAKQEAAAEKRGEKALRNAAGDTEKAADVAGEAAEA